MFIKFFVEAKEEKEAIQIVGNGLDDTREKFRTKEIKSVVPYWKIENTYIVEMDVELCHNSFQKFLETFSDKWLELGYPVDEMLASKDNGGCTYMKNGFVLIDIFL